MFSAQEADATAQILMANGVPTKVVWFCGGHGVCANNFFDMRDGQVIEQRTLQWLDRYVKNVAGTPTGPQFEWVDQRGQWFSSDEYPVKKGTPIVATAGAATLPLIPYLGGSGDPVRAVCAQGVQRGQRRAPPQGHRDDVRGGRAGTHADVFGHRDQPPRLRAAGRQHDGLVLGSLITPVPVTLDGKTHTVTVSLEPVAHTLRPDESVTLQLVSSSGTYERILPSLGVLNIEGVGGVSLPTADAAVVSSPTTVQVTTAA